MQVTMTYHKYKNKRKSKIKSMITTILILLFAIVSCAVLVSEKKKLRAFDERIFYFVSAGSSKNISLLDDKKELLKNLGGANVLFEQDSEDEIKGNISK